MKICVVAVNKEDYAPKRIFEEGIKRGHKMHLTTWLDLCLDIKENSIFFGDSKKSLENFDAIIPRSPNFSAKLNGKPVSKHLISLFRLLIEYAKEKKIFILNEKFFTSYQSLDKLAQQYFLFKNNLPGISSAYFSKLNESAKKILTYPLILKTAQGSLGKGIFKAVSLKNLREFISKRNMDGKHYLFQKYYPIVCDYRVLVIRGKAIGVMKRKSENGEWRTNVSLGGSVSIVKGKLEKNLKRLAQKVAKKMSLDYVGVDILEYGGKLHIIEVNSLAQFRGFEKAFPKINVAKEIIKLVESKEHV